MLARPKQVLRHVLYALRGGFLVRPLAMALLIGAFGVAVPFVEAEFPVLDVWGALYHPPGVVRVVLRSQSFAKLLNTAFDQVVQYGKSDAAVTLRVLSALGDIASVTNQPAYLSAVRACADKTSRTCDGHLSEEARESLAKRLESIHRLTDPSREGP